MSYLIVDTTGFKVYDRLKTVALSCGKSEDFADELWESVLKYRNLYDELIWYFNNGTLKDEVKFKGYSLTDMYVHRIDRYNVFNDTGKNTAACNKDAMILETFKDMASLMDDPDSFIARMREDRGMDKL